MPHCIIECPAQLSQLVDFTILVKAVHDAAESSDLFEKGDIKARIVISGHYVVGGEPDNYVHVTSYILTGRSTEQKKALSNAIVQSLISLLPSVTMLSSDIREIRKETYSNRNSLL